MDDSPRDERRPGGSPGAPRVTGKVIKGDSSEALGASDKAQVRAPRAGVVSSEDFEARTEAKQIVLDAHKKADEIKAEALRYKEEVFAKAREEAKADVQARAAEEIAKAKLQAGQIIANTEKDILELALKVAEKIIGRELERTSDVLLDIVSNAIGAARASKAMTIRVHPDDGKLLREKRPRLVELIGRSVDLAIKDDSEVERGGCVIQTDFGTIDGQLKTQFEMLRNVLYPDTGKKEQK